ERRLLGAGDRDVSKQPEGDQDAAGEQNLVAELRQPDRVDERLEEVHRLCLVGRGGLLDCRRWDALFLTPWLCRRGRGRGRHGPGCFGGGSPGSDLAWLAEHRDASTRLLDRLAGAVAECVRLDGQLPLQAAGAEDLDVHAGVDQPRLEQRRCVDLGSILEAAQLRHVDHRVDLLERVLEAGQLGDALGEGHLAALESEPESLAARVLAFLTAAGGLAPAGTGAATDAARRAMGTARRLPVGERHLLISWLRLFVWV